MCHNRQGEIFGLTKDGSRFQDHDSVQSEPLVLLFDFGGIHLVVFQSWPTNMELPNSLLGRRMAYGGICLAIVLHRDPLPPL